MISPRASLLLVKQLCFIAERQPCGRWIANIPGTGNEPLSWHDVEAAAWDWLLDPAA